MSTTATAQSEFSKVSWHTQGGPGGQAAALYWAIAAIGVDEAYERIFKYGPKPEHLTKLLSKPEIDVINAIRAGGVDDHGVYEALSVARNDQAISEEPPVDDVLDVMVWVRNRIHAELERSMDTEDMDITAIDLGVRQIGVWTWSLGVRKKHLAEFGDVCMTLTLRADMSS